MTDTLEFKIIDPKKKGESWAESGSFPEGLRAVEIYINGQELVDIVREIEDPFAQKEGHPNIAGAYGHNTPKFLYKELSEAFDDNSYSSKYGVPLLCCRDCGVWGCWDIDVMVRRDDEFVYWENFRQGHRKNWLYNLSYKFDRTEYEREIEKLKGFAHIVD